MGTRYDELSKKKTPLAAAQINMLFALGVITLTEVDDHEFMNLQ